MPQTQWESYLLGEDYQHDIVRECITQIGAKIFGKDHAGSNAYIHLRRQIREVRVSLLPAWSLPKILAPICVMNSLTMPC